jgi:hypothetical protein
MCGWRVFQGKCDYVNAAERNPRPLLLPGNVPPGALWAVDAAHLYHNHNAVLNVYCALVDRLVPLQVGFRNVCSPSLALGEVNNGRSVEP